MNRRDLIGLSALFLIACGGSETGQSFSPAPPPPTPNPVVWNISLSTISAGTSVQLPAPVGAKSGGVYSVSATGTQLPQGVSLSPTGVLTVANTVPTQSVKGVIFQYIEP